jgi:NAD(P)-dependent dehydrogenase (short-subunit alcohol dehydrogenase family)
MRLKDKVALITGANSGIGKAIAERFAAEGAHVAVNYLPIGHAAADVDAELKTFGPTGIAVAGDVSVRAEVEKMFADTVAKFGHVDIALSNAGMEIKKPFVDVTDAEWNKVINVNLYGSFLVSQVAARQMIKQGNGGHRQSMKMCLFHSTQPIAPAKAAFGCSCEICQLSWPITRLPPTTSPPVQSPLRLIRQRLTTRKRKLPQSRQFH